MVKSFSGGIIELTGQQVEVFFKKIRRLVYFVGFSGVGLDTILKLTFINGFLDTINTILQQVSGVMTNFMSDIISRASI